MDKFRNFIARRAAIFLLAAFFLPFPARGLIIKTTYDASVTNLANAAQVEGAFSNAVQTFQNLYTNAITVNITVYWGNAWPYGSIGLGASFTEELGTYTYSQVTNAFRAHRNSIADTNALASLPSSDPIAGNAWWVPQAEIKALGLPGLAANDPGEDGAVGFASDQTYTFDPTNRAVAGKLDFIGAAEHEISEVLGRIYGLNYMGVGYVPYDLFRFTNNAARNFSFTATNVYFSVDNGVTALDFFYTNVNLGDIQDWQSSSPEDSFDAFVTDGGRLMLSAADVIALDIIGYNSPHTTVPHLTGVQSGSGNFQVNFTNTSGASFTVQASTNLISKTNWIVLGNPTEISSGHFQYTDAATNQARFYRVSSP